MAKRLQHRGGTTSQHSTFTGAVREVTVDTDKNTLVVHDGATAGGHPLATATNFTSTGIDDNATSTAITIDSFERVGIGTSSPSQKLEVNGGGTFNSNLTIQNAVPRFRLIDTDINGYSEISYNTNFLSFQSDSANNALNSKMNFTIDGSEKMRIETSGNIGIGTSSPASLLHIYSAEPTLIIQDGGAYGTNATPSISLRDGSGAMGSINYSSAGLMRINQAKNNDLTFQTNGTERMRIDSSGNFMVGKTTSNYTSPGVEAKSNGNLIAVRDSGNVVNFVRNTNDGSIVTFAKDTTNFGSIGVNNSDNIFIGGLTSNHSGIEFASEFVLPRKNNALSDNTVNLGSTSFRYNDLYLGGGLYVGGTGSANKLDDYEEGTWSPSIQASGNHFSSRTHGDRIGYYTKVGRLVTAHFRVNCTAVTVGSASGALQVESLPFTASNLNTNLSHAGSLYSMDNINFDPAGTFGTANIGLRTNANDNKGTIKIVRNNGASAGVAAATAINSNSEIEGVLIYFTD